MGHVTSLGSASVRLGAEDVHSVLHVLKLKFTRRNCSDV